MPQGVVAHELLGILQDGVRFLGAVQCPEQVARGRHRDRRALPVVPGLRRQAGEQPLRLRASSRARERPPERQPCAEVPARLHRRSRQTLGQHHVGCGQGLIGCTREQRGVVARARFQPPDGDPQQVTAPPRAARLHHVREPCVDRLESRGRQLRAHRLAVQWMGDVDEPSSPVRAALDELAALQLLQCDQLVGLQQRDLQRSANRHQLQHAASALADVLDAHVDEFRQPRPRLDLAAPAPHSAVLGQHAAIEAVAYQLAQEQGIASGPLPQRVDAVAVHRTAQRGVEESLEPRRARAPPAPGARTARPSTTPAAHPEPARHSLR